jgi:catechol 2,3-dioxygenase-like lactoylglutathione lyase family enzyme
MSSVDVSGESTAAEAPVAAGEMKLEALILPVGDVDRAKEFYERLGWRLDADVEDGEDFRLVQMTPPGSACSIHFGKGLTAAEPGSFADMHLVVSDLEATREDLASKGIEVSEVFHCATGFGCRYRDLGSLLPGSGLDERVSGRDPEGQSYSSFAAFNDPDGNTWLFQEIIERLPGR